MVALATLTLVLSAQDKPFTQAVPDSTITFEMMPIPGGTISIRDQEVEVKPFHIAKTETTWELFDTFIMSGDPSPPYDQTKFPPDAIARPSRSYILPDLGWGHHGYPAINVSITTVTMFCRWLSSVTGKTYRLPTEAEWEMAARGGSDSFGPADEIAWHKGNAAAMTHPVAKMKPNGYGLYDVFGNVGEWAIDLEGKEVLCGPTLDDTEMDPTIRRYWHKSWQETDPQLPKSRWWLSDGYFVGFRLVCEMK